MTDLSEIRKTLEAIDRDARALRLAIETNQRLREEIAAAPLCKADVAAVMEAQIDTWASRAPQLFNHAFSQIASRPGKAWTHDAPVLPDEGGSLSYALMALLADQLKPAVVAAITARQEDANAGDPWAARAVILEQLDSAIAADEASLSALRDQVVSSGLSWPGRGLYE